MEERAFLKGILTAVKPLLPTELRQFETSQGFALVKVFYGNPKLHYEVNHQRRAKTLEVGLHFEADGLTNARLLGAFRTHERAIRRELKKVRCEEWDKGWSRLWEPIAYQALDAALQRDVAALLALYIAVLEPVLRDELPSDVEWKIAARRTARIG